MSPCPSSTSSAEEDPTSRFNPTTGRLSTSTQFTPYLTMIASHGVHRSFACALNNIGAILQIRNQYSQAMGYYQESIQFRTCVRTSTKPHAGNAPTENNHPMAPDPTDMTALCDRAESVWRYYVKLKHQDDGGLFDDEDGEEDSADIIVDSEEDEDDSDDGGYIGSSSSSSSDDSNHSSSKQQRRKRNRMCYKPRQPLGMYQRCESSDEGPELFDSPMSIELDEMGDCAYESSKTLYNMGIISMKRSATEDDNDAMDEEDDEDNGGSSANSKAEQLLEMALSLAPGNCYELVAPILNNLARIYYTEGNYDDAQDTFAEAVEMGREIIMEHPLRSSKREEEGAGQQQQRRRTKSFSSVVSVMDDDSSSEEEEEDEGTTDQQQFVVSEDDDNNSQESSTPRPPSRSLTSEERVMSSSIRSIGTIEMDGVMISTTHYAASSTTNLTTEDCESCECDGSSISRRSIKVVPQEEDDDDVVPPQDDQEDDDLLLSSTDLSQSSQKADAEQQQDANNNENEDEKAIQYHELLSISLSNMARCYHRHGDYRRAIELLTEVYTIQIRLYSPQTHYKPNVTRFNLGLCHQSLQEYDLALVHHESFYQWSSRVLGNDHDHVATSLFECATIQFDTRNLSLALPMFLRSLSIRESRIGPNHPETANVLYNLGRLLHDREEYGDSLDLYKRALVIQERRLGATHPSVVRTLCNIGRVSHVQGRLREALEATTRVVSVVRSSFAGRGNESFLAGTLVLVGNIHLELGNVGPAMAAFEESRVVSSANNNGGGTAAGGVQGGNNANNQLPMTNVFVSPLHYHGFDRELCAASAA